jgi:hypothetical protein
LDHVSDWFKILLKSGVPALLIGMGWVESFFGSLYFGSSWNTGPGFAVINGIGVMMIGLGAWLNLKELALIPKDSDDS